MAGIDTFIVKALEGAPNFLFALIGYWIMFRVIVILLGRVIALEREVIACYQNKDDPPPQSSKD